MLVCTDNRKDVFSKQRLKNEKSYSLWTINKQMHTFKSHLGVFLLLLQSISSLNTRLKRSQTHIYKKLYVRYPRYNLGPKLFILYINDICNTSNVLKFILFADDTNSFTGSNLKEICQVITSELEKLNIWFSLNKLLLNVTKSYFPVVSVTSLLIKKVHFNNKSSMCKWLQEKK